MRRSDTGRAELLAWERSKPRNYLLADPNFEQVLQMHLGERAAPHWPLLVRTAEDAAGRMDLLARETNRDEHLPELRRYSGVGERVEEVVFSPAYHELGALFWRQRRAFGRPILEFPAVQQTLARMKLLTCAATATTFRILALSDRLAAAGGDLRAARRVHVNINKYATAIACTEVVRSAIEILGGNGTIEELSVLPRLYRDAIVLESWEGTQHALRAGAASTRSFVAA